MNGSFIQANPSNYTVGRAGHKPNKVVMHTMDGFYNGTISWFKNPTAKSSTHFLVSKNGEVCQMVKLEDAAWGAGVKGATLKWVQDINLDSIHIEHEDERNPNGFVRSAAMLTASAEILVMLHKTFGIPLDRQHVLLHREIPGVTKSCPGNLPVDAIIDLARSMVGQPVGGVSAATNVPANTVTKVTVLGATGLNLRTEPKLGKNIVKAVPKGTVLDVEKALVGESVSNVDKWWKLKGQNLYAWAGATNVIPTVQVTPAPTPPKKEETAPQSTVITPTPSVSNIVDSANPQLATLQKQLQEKEEALKNAQLQVFQLEEKVRNIETFRTSNSTLSQQLKDQEFAYQTKISELKNDVNNAMVAAFKEWQLLQIDGTTNSFMNYLKLCRVLHVLFVSAKDHKFVLGWKVGGELVKVNEPKPITNIIENS